MHLQCGSGAVVGDREALGHLDVGVYGVHFSLHVQVAVDLQIRGLNLISVDHFQVVTKTRE